MKLVVTASPAVWTSICDVLSAVFPLDIVAILLHVEAELFLGLCSFHDRIYCIYEIHFPTLTSHCNSILTISDTVALLVYLGFVERCHSVLLTYLITELPKVLQCELVGVVLQTCVGIDCVEHEVVE